MRKLMLNMTVLLMFIYENQTSGQPVLEQEDITPRIGDEFFYIQESGFLSIALITGQDTIWDFIYDPSSTNPQHVLIKDPSSTPYHSQYPAADFCEVIINDDSTYTTYSFQENVGSLLEEQGSVSTYLSSAQYAYYDDYRKLMQFPVQYGDSIRDTYFGFINKGEGPFPRHGVRTCKVDGYGTLVYSTGDTITDVLKILCHDYYVDSLSLSYDSTFSNTRAWFKAGIRAPLIYQRSGGIWSYIYATQLITSIGGSFYRYLDPDFIHEQLTAVEQPAFSSSNDFVVYPNPSLDGQITINSSINIDEVKILNILGSIRYQANPNSSRVTLYMESDGIYIVQLKAGGRTFLKKVIISNR